MIQFDEALNLATYRVEGVFDTGAANEMLDFLQAMENALPGPFNRFLDLKGILEVRLTGTDIYRIAKRRRSAAEKVSVCRSAIFAPGLIAHGVAQIYQELMEGSNIQVGVFSEAKGVAEWLGVPESALGLSNEVVGTAKTPTDSAP